MHFLHVLNSPDRVVAQREQEWIPLWKKGRSWEYEDICVTFIRGEKGAKVTVRAGEKPLSRILCFWLQKTGDCKVLNDHSERPFADVEWYSIPPDRPHPT